jgi:hypothetical protein
MFHLEKNGRGDLGAATTAMEKQKSHGQRPFGLSMA